MGAFPTYNLFVRMKLLLDDKELAPEGHVWFNSTWYIHFSPSLGLIFKEGENAFELEKLVFNQDEDRFECTIEAFENKLPYLPKGDAAKKTIAKYVERGWELEEKEVEAT